MTVSCSSLVDHLCQFQSNSVYSYSEYRVHNFDNRRANGRTDERKDWWTEGQAESIIPSVSLWRKALMLVKLRAMQASPCLHGNGLASTDNMLGYGHRGWPTVIVAGLRSARLSYRPCRRRATLARDGQRDGQGKNMMPRWEDINIKRKLTRQYSVILWLPTKVIAKTLTYLLFLFAEIKHERNKTIATRWKADPSPLRLSHLSQRPVASYHMC